LEAVDASEQGTSHEYELLLPVWAMSATMLQAVDGPWQRARSTVGDRPVPSQVMV